MSVTAGAGLEFQGLSCLVKSPNAGKGDVKMPDYQLATSLEHRLALGVGVEGDGDFRGERGHAHTVIQQFLGTAALFDFVLQFAVCIMQRALSLLALGDVGDTSLDDTASAPLDAGQ